MNNLLVSETPAEYRLHKIQVYEHDRTATACFTIEYSLPTVAVLMPVIIQITAF
jgi:hypothetical protein